MLHRGDGFKKLMNMSVGDQKYGATAENFHNLVKHVPF